MARAYSPSEILKMKKKVIPFSGRWFDFVGTPEFYGTWFIYGNSANGKTGLLMQAARELAQFGTVLYNPLEEGTGLTTQEAIRRYNMQDISGRVKFLNCEPIEELSERLLKPKSPQFVIIDSFQYTQLTYKSYIRFKELHRNKLIIFSSHAEGKNPSGRSAKSVMYDATQKIWVEGHRAINKGRSFGPLGYYDIWPEKSALYWGDGIIQP